MSVRRLAPGVTGKLGLVALVLALLIVLVGPFFAPYDLAKSIGAPGSPPGSGALLGTDFLGRDVLSRALNGGRSVLWLGIVATVVSYAFGLTVGLTAGYSRSRLDPILMRSVDLLLAFPALVILLLLVSGLGTSAPVLLLGVALIQLPAISRLVRIATLQVSTSAFVEAAVARGEATRQILRHDILPNIASVVLADMGLRFGVSVLLIASMNYLGFGLKPPTADWGLMIAENRLFVATNPWASIAPAAMLALLMIGVNLLSDAYAQTLGRSSEEEIGLPAEDPAAMLNDAAMPSLR